LAGSPWAGDRQTVSVTVPIPSGHTKKEPREGAQGTQGGQSSETGKPSSISAFGSKIRMRTSARAASCITLINGWGAQACVWQQVEEINGVRVTSLSAELVQLLSRVRLQSTVVHGRPCSRIEVSMKPNA